MSSLIAFFKSRVFLFNLFSALVFMLLLVIFTYRWLDSFTNHGESISVPDLRGLKAGNLAAFLENKHVRFKIADSSIYDLKNPPGTVIEQDPTPNEKVKEGRTIYVSITRTVAPLVKMPNLVDNSYRQAEAILESNGLKVGMITYKPDLARNAVLGQLANGKEIKAGTEIPKGTRIDLILGDGLGNTIAGVPKLYSLTLSEALFVLKASMLNAGAVIFDASVKDSTLARIYKQSPEAGDSAMISQGQAIDIYLTQSEAVLKIHENHEP